MAARRRARVPPAGDHRPRRASNQPLHSARCISSSTARSTTTSSCAASCEALGHAFRHRGRRRSPAARLGAVGRARARAPQRHVRARHLGRRALRARLRSRATVRREAAVLAPRRRPARVRLRRRAMLECDRRSASPTATPGALLALGPCRPVDELLRRRPSPAGGSPAALPRRPPRGRRYWRPGASRSRAAYEAPWRVLRELLEDSIRLRLRSDVPVGTSLSGGVDSSAIVCLSARSRRAPRHAFTARFRGSPATVALCRGGRPGGRRAGASRGRADGDELLADLDGSSSTGGAIRVRRASTRSGA